MGELIISPGPGEDPLNSTERAHELYANATKEKVSLISLLKANEADRQAASDRLFRNMDMGTKVSYSS